MDSNTFSGIGQYFEPPGLGGAQRRTAVPAGVVERPQLLLAVADQQYRLVADPEGPERRRRRQRVRAAKINPVAAPDRGQLTLVMRRIVVPGALQRALR